MGEATVILKDKRTEVVACPACYVAESLIAAVAANQEGVPPTETLRVGDAYAAGAAMGMAHTIMHLEQVHTYLMCFCELHKGYIAKTLADTQEVLLANVGHDHSSVGRLHSVLQSFLEAQRLLVEHKDSLQ